MLERICDTIFILYLYADMTKMIHYTCETDHEHKLCDDVRDAILSFTDELAEQSFGYYGRPKFSDFTLKHDVHMTDDLGKLCGFVSDSIEYIRKEYENDSKHANIVSLIDDFNGQLKKLVFLATFNKVSKFTFEKK